MDRLLEQVLVEKSSSFYKEIENLVEEHLISTGHYTRYDRDKSQRSDAQPRSELTKLSDKEVEDIIKEETNKFLEASADERSQESERGSYADTPPPGTSGEVTEVETLINVTNDKESAKSSQGLNTNLEASSAPDSSTGKLGVEMPASEESGLKGETEVIRKLDESIVSKAQNVDDLSQTDGSKDHESSLQETNALISETENPGSAKIAKEASEIIQEPVVITEASTVSASTTRETNLFFPNESSTSNQGTSASQGKVDMTMSEITKSDDSAPDSEANQPTDATVVQASISQYDIAKGGELNVDLPAVQIGIERKESKAETEKENTATEPTPTTEIKQAKISKSRADNPEVVKPKAEKVKTEVPKSGEAKPEIFQPEIVKPEVGKPKVDKTRRPEEDMKVVKPEITKPKVNKVPSKPAVGKTKVSKPEVSKVELFSPDVITAKVVKAPKLEEKVKTRTKTEKQRSKKSIKPKTKEQISMSKLFSTDEETDEDLGIPSGKISANKSKKSKPEVLEADNADFSDSDITVSSVHTSDLSSLEDSMSDMEYEDYQELVLKKGKGKESGAGGSTKSGGESGASGIETVDKKKINPGTLDSGGGKIENVDTKKKKSVESGADVKEEIKEKGSKEISQGERSGESGTSVCEDTDSKSRNLISTRIDTKEQNKEKMFDESGAASPKVDDESGDSVEKSDSKEKKPYHSDISSDEEQNNKNDEKDLQQKTKARRSDFTESEAKTASQGKEQANLHPSKSDPALFKPIEPAEPQVFSEPAAKRRGEPAFAQATDGASDADNETTIEDSDGGNTKLGRCHSILICKWFFICHNWPFQNVFYPGLGFSYVQSTALYPVTSMLVLYTLLPV